MANITATKYRPTTVMLRPEHWKALKIRAVNQDESLSDVLNAIIARDLMR